MDEITRLRRQLKMLTIALVAVAIVTMSVVAHDVLESKRGAKSIPELTVKTLRATDIRLVSAEGEPKLFLSGQTERASMAIVDSQGEPKVLISVTPDGIGFITLRGEDKAHSATVTGSWIKLGSEEKGNIKMITPPFGGPSVSIRDENGYGTTMGKAEVIDKSDGTQYLTSAASIVVSSRTSTAQLSPLKKSTGKESGDKSSSVPVTRPPSSAQ